MGFLFGIVCPHSAFKDPATEGVDVEPRESVEVRCFALF